MGFSVNPGRTNFFQQRLATDLLFLSMAIRQLALRFHQIFVPLCASSWGQTSIYNRPLPIPGMLSIIGKIIQTDKYFL